MMFSTDKQTLDDLEIFVSRGEESIYQLFNRCVTRGGAALLEDMFRHPLPDPAAINRRSGIIGYFAGKRLAFPFQSADIAVVEPYLENTDERTRLSAQDTSVARKISNMISQDAEEAMLHKGVMAMVSLLRDMAVFVSLPVLAGGEAYRPEREAIEALIAIPELAAIIRKVGAQRGTLQSMAAYDVTFRFRHRESIQKLLRYVYNLDVYISVARVACDRGFVFPKAFAGDKGVIRLEGVYHPKVKQAVPNSIFITPESNVIFLTGANMAGKSTFMKSVCIALFLAHMGFPVAAEEMEFAVLDGMYTTINLPDNLGAGASHFYAEVLRLRKVAQELGQGKRLLVVFDELFRGTNVKDAYEATIEVTAAFAERKDSIFVISTHIIEAGDVLRERCKNVRFVRLPTRMEGSKPVYSYTLEEGITDDRHGMIIVRNERILAILEQGVARENN